MKVQVGTATQYEDIDQGITLLNVPYNITDDEGAILSERNQSFPLNTTEEDIKAFLASAMQVYKDNVARHEEAKVLQDSIDQAQETSGRISGITITD